MTQRLEKVLNRASETADTLFQEVLGRKDKADSTRNALNVLQRFKFLFNLPLNIERNIQKGDYDVVINDYEKAKSLFGNTEVPVFKKERSACAFVVYSEVETRIEALRKLLLDKLLETPSTLHDQKRYIRYLSDLHAPGDPAWQCIVAQHKWILQLMQNCKEDFIKEQKDYINNLIKTEKEKKERSLVPSSVREELLHNVYQFLSGNPVVVDFNLTTG
ncbi:exocyst complex component 2-like protein [Labeo rohita]|uniref:Exocyst complex component 2 n=1 Tax=Labeo rohita TaxID=84645 RepID=A0A498NXK9_LABRO|nr:exocyst complex component 2-like protein [Labeo rohita]